MLQCVAVSVYGEAIKFHIPRVSEFDAPIFIVRLSICVLQQFVAVCCSVL